MATTKNTEDKNTAVEQPELIAPENKSTKAVPNNTPKPSVKTESLAIQEPRFNVPTVGGRNKDTAKFVHPPSSGRNDWDRLFDALYRDLKNNIVNNIYPRFEDKFRISIAKTEKVSPNDCMIKFIEYLKFQHEHDKTIINARREILKSVIEVLDKDMQN